MNEHWKEHFDHDIALHRKTTAIYDHVALRYLHARFGGTGNVVAVLWQAI